MQEMEDRRPTQKLVRRTTTLKKGIVGKAQHTHTSQENHPWCETQKGELAEKNPAYARLERYKE